MSEELERVYTINLGKVLLSQSQHRSVRALNMIREFARRHMRTQSIKIDEDLAQQIWARGARRPPRKIRVRMYKTDTGDILVSKYEIPVESLPTDNLNVPKIDDDLATAAIDTTTTTTTTAATAATSTAPTLPEPIDELSDKKEIDADFDDIGLGVDDKRDDESSNNTANIDTSLESYRDTHNVSDSSLDFDTNNNNDDVSKTRSEPSASDAKSDDHLDTSDDTTTTDTTTTDTTTTDTTDNSSDTSASPNKES